ncbi:MAG: cupin domain-containing protein [Actinomycetota bacterium]|nr:cupin domain-containing protein [Actinomycetota bacterium]
MRAGDELINPVTGERILVRRGSGDGGRTLLAELTLPPGSPPVGQHRHRHHTETLVVLSGRIAARIAGRQREAGPGARLVVQPRVWHDWWNAGDADARVLLDARPGIGFEELLATLFGLARDGRTDAQGRPGLLQSAILGMEYRDVIELRSPPPVVQRALMAPFAVLGRALGLRGYYDEYLEPAAFASSDGAVRGGRG